MSDRCCDCELDVVHVDGSLVSVLAELFSVGDQISKVSCSWAANQQLMWVSFESASWASSASGLRCNSAKHTMHEVEKLVDDLRIVVGDARGAQKGSKRLCIGRDVWVVLVLSEALVIDGNPIFRLDRRRGSKVTRSIHD